LQIKKQRHCITCNKLRNLSGSEKISEMNKENHRFSTNKALKLHNINAWCMHYIKYKQSEDDHQKADEE